MTKQEAKARKMLKGMTMNQLLDQWEMTSVIKSTECYTVRGWLMDEIRSRDPKGYEAWLDTEDCDDRMLRRYVS